MFYQTNTCKQKKIKFLTLCGKMKCLNADDSIWGFIKMNQIWRWLFGFLPINIFFFSFLNCSHILVFTEPKRRLTILWSYGPSPVSSVVLSRCILFIHPQGRPQKIYHEKLSLDQHLTTCWLCPTQTEVQGKEARDSIPGLHINIVCLIGQP